MRRWVFRLDDTVSRSGNNHLSVVNYDSTNRNFATLGRGTGFVERDQHWRGSHQATMDICPASVKAC